MGIKNENVWIGDEINNFARGEARKVLLTPEFRIFKASGGLLANSKGEVTSWWIAVNGIDRGDPGLQGLRSLAERMKVSLREYIRARAAVKSAWNDLSGMLHQRMTIPIWAWYGRARHQPVDEEIAPSVFRDTANVVSIGGMYQLWIPNLEPKDLVNDVPY